MDAAEGSEAEASGPNAGILCISTLITWSAKELVLGSALISGTDGPEYPGIEAGDEEATAFTLERPEAADTKELGRDGVTEPKELLKPIPILVP